MEAAAALLRAGARAARDDHQRTPLAWAAQAGQLDALRQLTGWFGADVTGDVDARGRTPLHYAAFHGHVGCVEYLLTAGAAGGVADGGGATPLHLAAYAGHASVARVLLKHGVDVNAQNDYDETALHIASKKGSIGVVITLLKNNADIKMRNKDNNRALSVALESGYPEIVTVLSDAHNMDPDAKPAWLEHLEFPSTSEQTFGQMSKGVEATLPNRVRFGSDAGSDDGTAVWNESHADGSHVYEVAWPAQQRGRRAVVGLAPDGEFDQMVASCRRCGLNLVTGEAVAWDGSTTTIGPTDGGGIPDEFLMHFDATLGEMGFGTAGERWGGVVLRAPDAAPRPLAAYANASMDGGQMEMLYRGREKLQVRQGMFASKKYSVYLCQKLINGCHINF